MAPRSLEQRKADTRQLLETEIDAWIATAGDDGAHLVPLSLFWDGEVVTLATVAESPTARNAKASGRARIAVGPTRDVVMIDGAVEVVPLSSVPAEEQAAFADRCGWNPADEPGEWVYLHIRPRRVQAWRESDEIAGRTIMRDGRWLD